MFTYLNNLNNKANESQMRENECGQALILTIDVSAKRVRPVYRARGLLYKNVVKVNYS